MCYEMFRLSMIVLGAAIQIASSNFSTAIPTEFQLSELSVQYYVLKTVKAYIQLIFRLHRMQLTATNDRGVCQVSLSVVRFNLASLYKNGPTNQDPVWTEQSWAQGTLYYKWS